MEMKLQKGKKKQMQKKGKKMKKIKREMRRLRQMSGKTEILSTPMRHKDGEVMAATFWNGVREETCADVSLRKRAELGRLKVLAQRVEEREMVLGWWGGGTGWSGNGLGRLESRFGLGGNNRAGFNPRICGPNNSGKQKPDYGRVGWGTQNGSNSFHQRPTNHGSNKRENGLSSFLTRPNDLLYAQWLMKCDLGERQGSTQREIVSSANVNQRRGARFHCLSPEEMAERQRGTLGFKQWDPGGSPITSFILFLHLEDKVNFEGGGIDGPLKCFDKVYTRKAQGKEAKEKQQLVVGKDTWHAINGEGNIVERKHVGNIS